MLVDILYVCLAVSLVTVVGSSAQWWVVSLYVAVSAAVAFSPVGIAMGLVLYLVTFLSASRGESSRWIKAVVIGISVNLMFHSHLDIVFGLASLLGLISNCLLLYFGLKVAAISINAVRKKMLVGLSVFATIFLGLFLALLMAKDPLRNGSHSGRSQPASCRRGTTKCQFFTIVAEALNCAVSVRPGKTPRCQRKSGLGGDSRPEETLDSDSRGNE